jgi:PAS domain S-box-containing protein
MFSKLVSDIYGGESKYIKLLIDKLPYPIFIKNLESVYVLCNEKYASELGINVKEIYGKTDFHFYPPDLSENYRRDDKRIMQNGIAEDIEEKIYIKGEIRFIHTSKTPIYDNHGRITGIFGMFWDITEKKSQEFRIIKLNRFYKFISEINQAIFRAGDNKSLFDEVCRISVVFGNFRFAWIGLLDEEKKKIKPVASYGYEDDYLEIIQQTTKYPSRHLEKVASDLRKGKYFICNDVETEYPDYPWAAAALKRGYKSLAAFAIRVNEKIIGQFNLYSTEIDFFDNEEIALLSEVTSEIAFNIIALVNKANQKIASEKIRKSEEQFRTVWEKSFDAMRLSDKEGKMIIVNNSFCSLFKKDKNELEGSLMNTVYWKKDIEILNKYLREFEIRAAAPYLETEVTIWDRDKIWVEIANSYIELEGETMLLCIFRNITERKKAEEELLIAKEKAEESSMLKSSLLGNMSHELRTPLTGILGFTQILLDDITNQYHYSMVEKIKLSGQRLMTTLNSLLSLSELESGISELNISEIKINSIVNYLSEGYKIQAEEKGLRFRINKWKEDLAILADEKLFSQVFSNIVDNAIKYTESGNIEIFIRPDINEFGEIFVLIIISDTGIGIDGDLFDFIFDEFRQASEGFNRNFEGNGLGLTLARKMARIMGGDILVDSKPGKGSVFTIKFPIYQGEPIQKSIAMEVTHKNVRPFITSVKVKREKPEILVVEDNIINKEVIELFLKDVCKTDHAKSGDRAIALVSKKKYDAIIMDINLGEGINGIDAAKSIRGVKGYANIPIIAITGYAMSSDRDKILAEGIDYYLVKPIEKGELIDFIKKILGFENRKK